VEKSEDEIM